MKLGDWLKQQGISQGDLAGQLDPKVTQGTVSHWCVGRHEPALEHVAQIARITNGAVTLDDWIDPSPLASAQGGQQDITGGPSDTGPARRHQAARADRPAAAEGAQQVSEAA